MDEFSYEPYVWRGALGGAIGYSLLAVASAIYYWSYFGSQGLATLMVVGGVLGPIGGAVTGIIIGLIIWRVTLTAGKEPAAIMRFIIGAGAFLIYDLITHICLGREVWPRFSLTFAILGGGLSGLLAHRKGAVEA